MVKLFTSESVSSGHPDKMADIVSDTILDEVLTRDPKGRVAVETLLSAKGITIAGEVTTTAKVDYENVVRDILRGIDGEYEKQATFTNHIVEQSVEIANSVDNGGAGDQGMMFGYSTNETPEKLPLPIAIAHRIIRKLDSVRGELDYLLADAKSQVTVAYDGNDIPLYVETVIISTRHNYNYGFADISSDLLEKVIKPSLGVYYDIGKTKILINPAGNFTIGGPLADTGLTGRKIIVDTYGGVSSHGGGAFSGKDSSKVDRSGAYMARYIANNIVSANLADKCEVQLAYAIGVAEPVSVSINSFGTGGVSESKLIDAVYKTFDMTPRGITKELGLLVPMYAVTASGGHFGRTGKPWEFIWENSSKVATLLENIR